MSTFQKILDIWRSMEKKAIQGKEGYSEPLSNTKEFLSKI